MPHDPLLPALVAELGDDLKLQIALDLGSRFVSGTLISPLRYRNALLEQTGKLNKKRDLLEKELSRTSSSAQKTDSTLRGLDAGPYLHLASAKFTTDLEVIPAPKKEPDNGLLLRVPLNAILTWTLGPMP